MKQKFSFKMLSGLLAVLLLMGLAANVLITPASADEELSSSEIREQINEMEAQYEEREAQIRELESQLQDNLSEMEAIVAQKNIIDQEIFLLHQQVAEINEMISAYNVLIADKQAELNAAQERLALLNEQNKERIRAMEEDGALSYWAVLFKANSFSDLLDRLNMIEEIAAADQRRLQEMRDAADKVAAAQEALVTEKANLELVRQQQEQTEAELVTKRAEADQLLAELIATGEEYEAYMEEAEAYQQELAQQIADKELEFEDAKASESYEAWLEESRRQASIDASIAESIRQEEATRQTEPTYSKPDEEEEDDPPVSSSGWRSPMTRSTWVTSPYGMRMHPIHNEWRMHHGVDLEGDTGDTIVAARDGVVVAAAYHYSMGYYVTINHGDGYSSIYMHMTHFTVNVGDHVKAGQKIGECGSTGDSTGPHLHFGIYYNGQSVNPAQYVNFS